ncbi:MAG: hypothetical protein RL095_1728 [Verrucomicrobiota bacterium]|jgi:tetratricopeptide (TPR) repeat protein
MTRVLALCLALCLAFIAATAAEAPKKPDPYPALVAAAKLVAKSPENPAALADLTAALGKVPRGEVREMGLAGLYLGWRLAHDAPKSAVIYAQIQKEHKETFGNEPGEWLPMIADEAIGEVCNICAGSKSTQFKCNTCSGTGLCNNSKCLRGTVESPEYSFDQKKFINVKRPCPVCREHPGKCGDCKEGKLSRPCSGCAGRGSKLNRDNAAVAATKILESLAAKASDASLLAREAEMLAKGMVRRGDRWVTRAEAEADEKAAAAAAEARARVAEEARLKEERHQGVQRLRVLQTRALALAVDAPVEAVRLIDSYMLQEPASQSELQPDRDWIFKIAAARALEDKGQIEKAIPLYEEALKLRANDALAQRLNRLKDQSTGL